MHPTAAAIRDVLLRLCAERKLDPVAIAAIRRGCLVGAARHQGEAREALLRLGNGLG